MASKLSDRAAWSQFLKELVAHAICVSFFLICLLCKIASVVLDKEGSGRFDIEMQVSVE